MDTMSLPVILTADELAIKADLLAEKVRELDITEADKKGVMAEFKTKIDALSEMVSDLARIVHDKKEYRQVDIREIRNEERMTMDTVRLDTGEIVSYRDMKSGERVRPLFPVESMQSANSGV